MMTEPLSQPPEAKRRMLYAVAAVLSIPVILPLLLLCFAALLFVLPFVLSLIFCGVLTLAPFGIGLALVRQYGQRLGSPHVLVMESLDGPAAGSSEDVFLEALAPEGVDDVTNPGRESESEALPLPDSGRRIGQEGMVWPSYGSSVCGQATSATAARSTGTAGASEAVSRAIDKWEYGNSLLRGLARAESFGSDHLETFLSAASSPVHPDFATASPLHPAFAPGLSPVHPNFASAPSPVHPGFTFRNEAIAKEVLPESDSQGTRMTEVVQQSTKKGVEDEAGPQEEASPMAGPSTVAGVGVVSAPKRDQLNASEMTDEGQDRAGIADAEEAEGRNLKEETVLGESNAARKHVEDNAKSRTHHHHHSKGRGKGRGGKGGRSKR